MTPDEFVCSGRKGLNRHLQVLTYKKLQCYVTIKVNIAIIVCIHENILKGSEDAENKMHQRSNCIEDQNPCCKYTVMIAISRRLVSLETVLSVTNDAHLKQICSGCY